MVFFKSQFVFIAILTIIYESIMITGDVMLTVSGSLGSRDHAEAYGSVKNEFNFDQIPSQVKYKQGHQYRKNIRIKDEGQNVNIVLD